MLSYAPHIQGLPGHFLQPVKFVSLAGVWGNRLVLY